MIALYKPGDRYEVKGIKCEIGRFPAQDLQKRLKEGWIADPGDLYKEDASLDVLSDRLGALEKVEAATVEFVKPASVVAPKKRRGRKPAPKKGI